MRKFLFLLTSLCVLSFATAAWAVDETSTTVTDYSGLKSAISGSYSEIIVSADVISVEATLNITRTLTLKAADGTHPVLKFTGNNGNVIHCNGEGSGQDITVTISGFTITGGKFTEGSLWGGGIEVENANINITNCTIRDNTAYGGGGLLVHNGDLNMANCTVTGNTGTSGGNGGIYMENGNANIINCTFVNNGSVEIFYRIDSNASSGTYNFNAFNSIFWNDTNEAYIINNSDNNATEMGQATAKMNLYNCAYKNNAEKNVNGYNNKTISEWNSDNRKVTVDNMTVFKLLSDDQTQDTTLIDTGMTASDIEKELNKSQHQSSHQQQSSAPAELESWLKTDQLGATRDEKLDIGAIEYVLVSIDNTSLKAGTVGVAYSDTITATPEKAEVTVTGLPNGLTFSSNDLKISGTPTATGTSSVKIIAEMGAYSADKTLPLTINAQSTPINPSTDIAPVLAAVSDINATEGSAIAVVTITATAGTNLSWSVTGLPDGLSAASSGKTVTISGTPASGTGTTSGRTYACTVTASNSTGSASAKFNVIVTSTVNYDTTKVISMDSKSESLSDAVKDMNDAEKLAVTTLELSGDAKISNLSALSEFKNLKTLVLNNCASILSLDVALCENLEILEIKSCASLDTLNVSGSVNLKSMDMSGCDSMRKLVIVNCGNLTELKVSECGLDNLTIEKCAAIALMDLSQNHLGYFDWNSKDFPALKSLNCDGQTISGLAIVKDGDDYIVDLSDYVGGASVSASTANLVNVWIVVNKVDTKTRNK